MTELVAVDRDDVRFLQIFDASFEGGFFQGGPSPRVSHRRGSSCLAPGRSDCLAVGKHFKQVWQLMRYRNSSIVTKGGVREGSTVLITGIGGGVALQALQLW